MAKDRILVIEDDADILRLLQFNLEKDGYNAVTAESGERGLEQARSFKPGLILLDLMLPGIDGLEVCRILKHDSKTEHIPIIMLTARGEEIDIVTGLELGAEDYVTKPFSPKVLIARVRAVLRRRAGVPVSEVDPVSIHGLQIHPGKHSVTAGDKSVDLTPTEFSILHFLARHPGWVFTRYQIVDGIRDGASVVTDRSVDVQIVGIRRKLGEYESIIETVRGVGYRMKEE
jgi:two-component system alkaline phosphatase synthesis response regulator PhoP